TLNTAAIVKMTRTLAIIPITLVLAFLRTRKEEKNAKNGDTKINMKKIFPWFVLLFLLASVITTVLPIPAAVTGVLKTASKFFIVMAMAAIGLNTDLIKLVKTGGKPIFMGLCCWIGIAAVSLAIQRVLNLW
ncbi:MAG: putative sulfate exporter family transporter, partial [Clostridia bacterium]|nr:putative sulfate exporter family transporter [Clostridia bacterium]